MRRKGLVSVTVILFLGVFGVGVSGQAVVFETPFPMPIREHPANGTFIVELTALDAEASGNLIFSIRDANFRDNDAVVLDGFRSNGDLYYVNLLVGSGGTGNVFDYEDRQVVVIEIMATNANGESATVAVRVTLIDINDNPPVFDPLVHTVNVPENTPPNTVITTYTATDPDTGINSAIRYQPGMMGSNEERIFEVDSVTGEITLLRQLDYEGMQQEYRLTITATNFGSTFSSTGEVVVIVTDFNDHNPQFELASYTVQIYENLTVGREVLQVSAYDGDRGIDDDLMYTLSGQGYNTFAIDSFGNITLARPLNREVTAEYDLTLEVSEIMSPNSRNTTQVDIIILDINDNRPYFPEQRYNICINETTPVGVIVTTIAAIDLDEDHHAQLTYTIKESVPFNVDRTGVITVARSLDYETQTSYTFQLCVEEDLTGVSESNETGSGSGDNVLQSSTIVHIELIDHNDESPEFLNAPYNISLPEHSHDGVQVVLLDVDDRDDGLGGIFELALLNHNDTFELNYNVTFELIVRNSSLLDYEISPQYIINIMATDMGNPPLSSIVSVVVNLQNENDNVPNLPCPSFPLQVEEGSPMGHPVAALNATDADRDQLNYMISVNDSSPEGIEMYFSFSDGQLVTSSIRLDYEMITGATLNIIITDSDPTHRDECSYFISIIDLNDNTPMFTSNLYHFGVLENIERGELIGTVNATDMDSEQFGTVEYMLLANSTMVTINSSNGELYVYQPLDRESVPSFIVQVVATDNPLGDGNEVTTTVNVTVDDDNDNDPEFDRPLYEASVSEDMTEFAITVRATDRDIGTNAQLTYDILSSNISNFDSLLTIGPTDGVIRKRGSASFDREVTGNIYLTIVAYDNGTHQRNGTTEVLIKLLDVNDNPPQFSQSYSFNVRENVSIGYVVGAVSAHDPDHGANGRVAYSIGQSVVVPFIISETNPGDIVVNQRLDRETGSRYTFNVIAMDPAHNTSTQVTVNVIDVNDNPPRFTQRLYSVSIAEDTQMGTTILAVTATDEDVEPNNFTCYRLLNQDGSAPPPPEISIDNSTGEVIVSSELDYDGVSSTIALLVNVIDTPDCERNGNEFEDTVSLLVMLTDVNDNAPMFAGNRQDNDDNFIVQILEDTSQRTLVDTGVNVTDADDGLFGSVSVTADSTNNFAISLVGQSLRLLVITELNREVISQYTIVVNASDGGGLSKCATLIVDIVDINEAPPVFNQSEGYEVHVLEGSYQQQVIYTGILAEDIETGGNTTVMYSLDNPSSLFSINQLSGHVIADGIIDREMTSQFVLTVTASETQDLRSNTTLTIIVDDVNDNLPVIMSCSNNSVRETDVIGSVLFTVMATDEDDDDVLSYMIEDDSGTFNITDTGDVIANIILDYDEGDRQYNFSLTVSDSLNDTSSECSITIVDVNDNTPQFTPGCCGNVSIPESTANGTILPVNISAIDADSGLNGEVVLTAMFQFIDKFELVDNRIIVTGPLDYETTPLYELVIEAADRALNPRTANITIFVELINENDNDPTFNRSLYTFSMEEHSADGTLVGQVFVSDADGGPVSLTVLDAPFIIDGDGMLFTNQSAQLFDYDTRRKHYNFSVMATDGDNRTNTVMVVVSLTDINDNAPVFSQNYNTTLAAGNYSNQPLLSVTATDKDSSSNGDLLYSISPAEDGFSIDMLTGLLTVTGLFNINMTYSLLVTAEDNGDPSLDGNTTVTINVMDLNVGDLLFVNEPHVTSIPENLNIGNQVLTLLASPSAIPRYFLATNIAQFSVNPVNGTITMAQMLDYETDGRTYIFTVAAVDTPMTNTALTTVTINLLDVNDNGPRFLDRDGLQVSVAENSNISTLIHTFSTVDDDSAANSNTGYTILPTNTSSLFNIDTMGQLLLNGSLDREVASSYSVTIVAYDVDNPMLNSTIVVTIIVLDSNDHYPVFSQPYYTANITEAIGGGIKVVTVMASDQDEGDNGDIFFDIIDGDNDGYFIINTEDGCKGTIFTTAVPTDRERHPIINLTILASDRSSSPHTNTTTVLITLMDINDNAPDLTTPGPFPIQENVTTGPLLTLVASDADLPANGYSLVTYSLDQDFAGLFSLNFTTGELVLTNTLDRENVTSYTLTVTLQDTPDDGTPNQATYAVIIDVVDINDNSPQFSPLVSSPTVSEGAQQGTVVFNLTATDIDEGSNADVIITITNIAPNNPIVPFRVEPTGSTGTVNIVVNNILDRETADMYDVTVQARDRGNPSMSSTMVVNVLVLDDNDNAPSFPMDRYSFTVAEDVPINDLVATLSANDMDDNELMYRFATDTTVPFSILLNGQIIVNSTLDREITASYSFTVEVRDGVNDPDLAEVTITVLDVNDNHPEFTATQYNGTIMEGSLPSVAVTINPPIKANDADDPDTFNSRILYDLLGNDVGSEYFQLQTDQDDNIARITVSVAGHNNLDYEENSQYRLRVRARDGGSRSLTSTAVVVISVVDINDNAPMFSVPQYQHSVNETAVNGSLYLLTVSADDPDTDEANGGGVSYAISAGNTNLFAMDNVTGELSAIADLDAEDSREYTLTVVATDRRSPFNSGSVSVVVFINDLNDNAPRFNATQYLASVNETAAGNTNPDLYVTTIGVTDDDIGSNSRLNLTLSTDKFAINPTTFQLFTNPTSSSGGLDREVSPVEQFTVTACDNGIQQQCNNVTVSVTLLDVNDNIPQFDLPNVALTIRQSQLVNSVVAVFIANDDDIGSNAELQYSLSVNEHDGLFRVDPLTGSIILNQAIDASMINSSIDLVVTAVDQGIPPMSGSSIVTVTIVGETGLIPVFSQPLYNVSVFEDREPGQHVVNVSASSAATSNIRYSIDFPSEGFMIDETLGIITTTMTLNREDSESYSISVRAANEEAHTFALVFVRVIDANDHSPQFDRTIYTFDVMENNNVNYTVGPITATDLDSGTNAQLVYSIVAGDRGNFVIDPRDGLLIAIESLDREEFPSYTLTINVSDMGYPQPRSNSTVVTITVLDENDNSPELQDIIVETLQADSVSVGNTTSTVIIPENHPTYTSFITFDVDDDDDGVNGALMYSIIESPASSTPVFGVDPFLGELQNRNELDYDEGVNNYSLTVIVTDRGRPSHNLTHTVIVTVADINDCVPDFGILTSVVELRLDEEQDNGTLVMQFTATDCDSGSNSLLEYSVSGGNRHFTINSTTGHLTTNAVLDREDISFYNLVITAADHGMPSLNSSVQVEVELDDVNDNNPQFDTLVLPYRVSISESVPVSATVTTITANDDDVTSVVTYSISDPDNVFTISQSTGVVTLQQPLDRETVDEYNLTITASDGTRSNMTQLIVTVEDVNDNSPIFSDASCSVPVIVQEHTNETLVWQVSATDTDDGDNSRVVYSLLDGQGKFTINTTSGEIFLNGTLDHEIQAIYNLIVRAEDQSSRISERRATVCTLNVEVQDINDHAPEFVVEMFTGSVLENLLSDIGTGIVTVSATDQDRTHPNNAIQYSFSDQPLPATFMIDADSGVIRNIVPLDKEDMNCSVYNLTVVATNTQADPPLSGSVTVVITVDDVNEFEPSFVTPTPDRVNVLEYSHPQDTPVLLLFADDDDCSPDVVFSFSLLTRIANSPFSLDQNNGQLFLTGTLDYEQRNSYTLMFQVSDGSLTGNTSVIVDVIDENDNAPTFNNVDASVQEGINASVTTLNIVDDDHDDINTDSIVQLVSATGQSTFNATNHFSLDPITGELSAIMPLDRESDESFVLNITITNTRSGVECTDTSDSCSPVTITNNCTEPNSYYFTTDRACIPGCGGSFVTITECVEQCVCKLTSTKELLVTVTDINDNSPMFNESEYNGAITTTTEIGQNVLTVAASDPDKSFGPVVYDIVRTGSSDDSSRFNIERSSGVVVTAASFLDDAGKQFQFTVEARDQNGENGYRSAQALIIVAVLDDLQRVVITFQCVVTDLRPQEDVILMTLENITSYLIRVEEIGPHFVRNSITGVRLDRNDSYTDLVFHAVDRNTNKIVEGEVVISVLVHNIDRLEDVLVNDCKVDSAKPIQELLVASQEDLDSLQLVLIVLAAIIALGGVLMLCLSYRQRYVGTHLKRERYMADIFYGPGDTAEERHKVTTTTTENFEMVGEQPITQNQPIMVQPYSDWSQPVKENMRPSHSKQTLQRDNPLYESQEIRMEMFADMSETDFSEEDEAGLLAAAIADEDDEDVDELVTAI